MTDRRPETPLLDDEEQGVFRLRRHVIAGLLFGLLLVVGAGGWAATAELSGAVIAKGAVKVDRHLKAVQHRDGGIVGSISVKEGDIVHASDVLIRLEDAQTRAELSIVENQLAELSVKRARLIAERDGLPTLPSAELPTEFAQQVQQFSPGEARLLAGNLKNRQTQKEQLQLTINQLEEEINGLKAQQDSKLQEIALVEKEHKKIKQLFDRGLIEHVRVHTADRDLARLYGDKGAAVAGIARANAKVSETKLRIIAIDDDARNEAQRELSEVQPKLAELNERRIAIKDRLSRTDIRAPISGTVNELSVHTVGGVITPAETLLTIVPLDATLKIEARIMPTDIDQVQVGQAAKLRFVTFNQRTTPEVHGMIAYVSPATTVDKATGEAYYVAEVDVSEGELGRLAGAKLIPGMPVEVYVSTANRTALSYFVKPFTDQFSRAFREQ